VYPVDTPFDIPDNWEWVRFKDLVDYSMGKTPPRKETEYWSNGTLPWVSIADLVADGTVTATKECVNSFAAENTFKGKISKAGTLLMSFKLTVGKVSILGIDAFHNEAIISIYPFVDPDKITTMFLFATLPLLSQSGDTKSAIKGNTLNSDSLDALLIPLPPIMEQKRIFDKLHELTTPLLDYGAAEQRVTELNVNFPERLKKSILQEAVQGKLVPQDPSDEPAEALLERIRAEKQRLIKEGKIKKDKHESVIFRRDNSHYEKLDGVERCIDDELPFEIPENWCWCKIGTIFTLQAGKNIQAVEIHENPFADSYPCYGGNGIRGYVASSNRTGDYPIIGRQGALCGNINRATGEFYATEHAVCVETYSQISVAWACLFLTALNLNQYATATAQPGLAVANINEVYIPLPPLAEQHRIVQRIEKLLPLVKGL
jgi:type I restriction enzyme S subunit